MQTLPVVSQAVPSRVPSTRSDSKNFENDFLPTLNRAEAKTAAKTSDAQASRASERSEPTPKRERTEARQDADTGKERVVEADQKAKPSDDVDVAEVSDEQNTAQADAATTEDGPADENIVESDESDSAVVANFAAVSNEEVLPAPVAEESVAVEGDAVVMQDIAEEAVSGLPVQAEGDKGLNVAAQKQADNHNRQEVHKATAQAQDVAIEPLDDEVIAQKVKQQLVQPTSMKAESVQVVADGMGKLKETGFSQVEIVEGLDDVEVATTEKAGKVTDPRFASLLNRQDVETVLRQRQTPAQVAANSSGLSANGGEKMAETLFAATTNEGVAVDPAASNVGPAVENLLQQGAKAGNGGEHQAAALHTQAQPATTTATTSTFAPGQRQPVAVPDSHIVNQTVEHLSIHARGESSTVTVRLHPEELGELQLRMVMEGDQLKVHLHAQSQQVQDVLERNFPRLRDALQDQGVTVEDFQVSVDSGNAEQQQSFSQHSQSSERGPVAVTMDQDMMAQVAEVVPGVALDSSQGISVRI